MAICRIQIIVKKLFEAEGYSMILYFQINLEGFKISIIIVSSRILKSTRGRLRKLRLFQNDPASSESIILRIQ